MTITTVSSDQGEVLRNIMDLYHIQQFSADVTYGKGNFYKGTGIPEPVDKFDLNPDPKLLALGIQIEQQDVRNLTVPNNHFESVVFDPPFIHAPGKDSVMGNRFGGYPSQNVLRQMYKEALTEIYRVLTPKGILVFKCQDIVESGKQNWTHCHIWQMAQAIGFTMIDLFVLKRRSVIIGHNHSDQAHARKNHCYVLVFRKPK